MDPVACYVKWDAYKSGLSQDTAARGSCTALCVGESEQ